MSLTHVNYKTGKRYDMEAVTRRAHAVGALDRGRRLRARARVGRRRGSGDRRRGFSQRPRVHPRLEDRAAAHGRRGGARGPPRRHQPVGVDPQRHLSPQHGPAAYAEPRGDRVGRRQHPRQRDPADPPRRPVLADRRGRPDPPDLPGQLRRPPLSTHPRLSGLAAPAALVAPPVPAGLRGLPGLQVPHRHCPWAASRCSADTGRTWPSTSRRARHTAPADWSRASPGGASCPARVGPPVRDVARARGGRGANTRRRRQQQ